MTGPATQRTSAESSELRPVTTLRGVGESLAGKLAKLGITTVQDLLFLLPLRYEDRTRVAPIGSLRGADVERILRFVPYTMPYNVSGQPAISLPLHWSDAGLPLGIQLVARYGGEDLLLRVAAQLEQAQPWRFG